jgi:hypothetical protein
MSKTVVHVWEDDPELKAICVCSNQLRVLGLHAQWRVLSYLVLRFLGQDWALSKIAKQQ